MLPAAPSASRKLSRLDEKLGQMAQPDQQFLETPEDIKNYNLGSLLSGGDSDNNVIGATIFPHNIGLGCTRSADLVERAARITSEEVRATGANRAFAPCVAVPQDIRWDAR